MNGRLRSRALGTWFRLFLLTGIATAAAASPLAQNEDDQRIEESVRDAIGRSGIDPASVAAITVEARNGVVVLKGTVRDAREKLVAIQATFGVPEVRELESKLGVANGVTPDLEEAVWAELLHKGLDRSVTEVVVRDHIAHVTGKAADGAERDRVLAAVQEVSGIQSVENDIAVPESPEATRPKSPPPTPASPAPPEVPEAEPPPPPPTPPPPAPAPAPLPPTPTPTPTPTATPSPPPLPPPVPARAPEPEPAVPVVAPPPAAPEPVKTSAPAEPEPVRQPQQEKEPPSPPAPPPVAASTPPAPPSAPAPAPPVKEPKPASSAPPPPAAEPEPEPVPVPTPAPMPIVPAPAPAPAPPASSERNTAPRSTGSRSGPPPRLIQEIAYNILTYPGYTVFDNVEFGFDGPNVVLKGTVTTPTKKRELEERVKAIAGVGDLASDIRILPNSKADDQLRDRLFRRIYEDPMFSEHAKEPNPPIHIIVEQGWVTLTGMVDELVEKMSAEALVRNVFEVVGVRNQVRVRESMTPRR